MILDSPYKKITPDPSNRPLERIGKGEEITIREKSGIIFTFKDEMNVRLFWKAAKSVERSARDLDLCLFYCRTDGRLGGVFSDEYRDSPNDLGSLDRFPYILHSGDRILSTLTGEAVEEIRIERLDKIEIACICVVDYEAALNGLPVLFDYARAYVEFSTREGDNHRCNLKSPDSGAVYWVASICKGADGLQCLKRKRKVLSVAEAAEHIPGFKLICKAPEKGYAE